MKLTFDTLSIQNFGSFNEVQVLDFNSFDTGLHFLAGKNEVEPRLGSNGSGKSTCHNALCWCLYGKTPDGRRTPDIRPWSKDKLTQVQLTVTKDDAAHVIVRSAGPNSLTIDGHESHQEQIVELVGLDFDVFTHTILLGQGRPLFLDLEPREKMRVFSDVLQLERWDQRSKAAAERVASLRERELELTGQANSHAGTLEQTATLIAQLKVKAVEWESEREGRISAAQKEREGAEKDLTKLQRVIDDATLAYDSAMTEADALSGIIDNLQVELEKHRSAVTKDATRLTICARDVKRFEGELGTLGKSDKCPTCGQSTKGTGLAKHKAEIEQQLKALRSEITKGTSKKILDAFNEIKQQIERNRDSAYAFKQKADAAQTTVAVRTPDATAFKVRIAELGKTIEECERNNNPFQQQTRELQKLKSQLDAKQRDTQTNLEKTERMIKRAQFWVKGFKDVQLYIIEDVLQELEIVTNASLDEVGLTDWQVQYAVEKENASGTIKRGINTTILSPRNTKAVKWEAWSGGEGQRLRLIGALALSAVLLNHAGIEPSMEILDEPTAHLSDLGIYDLCDFLALRAQQMNRTIFYSDHSSIQSASFSSIITAVKTKAGTVLKC